jgi:hypothetical protein|tara:strand:- start:733 stop:1371 length:639 start_codon:yes stop_codon:yes gene_type:complete
MVAQQFQNTALEQDTGMGNVGLDTSGIEPESVDQLMAPQKLENEVELAKMEQESPSPESNKSDLADYLFNKLQEFGYPGRRLQEFRSKFVKKTIDAEGAKSVEVVIPSNYYGSQNQISDKDFGRMIKDIEQKYNLFFEGAENSDGKLTVRFTSVRRGDGEEMVEQDELSQVYGQPSASGGDSSKTSYTIHEMIKHSKNSLAEQLLKAIGAKQ